VVISIQSNGSRIGIDRVVVSGSVGKCTNLGMQFDVDLIAFVNEAEPPFVEKLTRIDELFF
jgi:hypothetical protein